jgi:exonuclease VII small subunit
MMESDEFEEIYQKARGLWCDAKSPIEAVIRKLENAEINLKKSIRMLKKLKEFEEKFKR